MKFFIQFFLLLLLFISVNSFSQTINSTNNIPANHRRGLKIRHPVEGQRFPGKDLNKQKRILFPPGNAGIWTEINPKVPRVDYYGVYFKDELNGFAVGEFGAIIKTTDGGNSWSDKSFPTDKTLLRVSGSDNFIVIVGNSGTILKSTDFGENWVSVNLVNNTDIWGTFTFSAATSFICTKDGRLLKTSNAGETWDIDTLGYPPNYWDMKFMNADTGFISLSAGRILKTTDSGNSWAIKTTGDLYSLYSVEILPNGNLVTAGQSGEIYYSTDFGNTFTQAVVPITFIIEDLAFADNNTGIAIGQATVTNAILKTSNGGITWDLINQQMGNLNIDFISGSVGYNVGYDLRLYKTSDEGNSWDLKILNDDFYDIEFLSQTRGYVLSGSLYETYNGGISWSKIPNGVGGYTIKFIDSLTGFIGNNNGIIYKTLNGGDDWYLVNNIQGAGQIKKISFSNQSIGWALSNNLYKTTDTGESWQQILQGTIYNDFYFVDSMNGWISGNGVQRTTDGGLSWEMINPSASFYKIHFIDQDTGYAVSGALSKTTDGGFTWSIVPGATGTELEVVDDSMIITLDDQGNNFISMDRGNTWTSYSLPAGRSLKFYDKSLGFFVGNTGFIYRYFDSTYVPVEFISFSANVKNSYILINWTTATETNNKGFEIQRSDTSGQAAGNGTGWSSIGFVNGNGTTTEAHLYSFRDENVNPGKYKYRLKQTDFDGSYEYSQEIEVEVSAPAKFELSQNYPNPFNPTTTIKYQLPQEGFVSLKVYDVLGNEVASLVSEQKNSGSYSVNFDASDLASGVYIYQLRVNEYLSSRKMLLLR